jgi:alpha-glucosidase
MAGILGISSFLLLLQATGGGAVTSPNGQLHVEIGLKRVGESPNAPFLRVTFKGRPVLLDSPLGANLVDRSTLGSDCAIEKSEIKQIHSDYVQFPGKRSHVVDHANELVLHLKERGPTERRWQLVVRAYDDGIAFRYRFPAQEGWPSLELAGERTRFSFPDDAVGFAYPVKSFTTSYETRWIKKSVAEIPSDWLLGLPLLVELPGTGWAAITEASLIDYAGLFLARAQGEGAGLHSRLAPLPNQTKVAVRAALPHDSPWRVVLVADKVGKLIESDLVLNLNPPNAIGDLSWIKPGKTTFPWWNGYHEENVPFEPGLNTATMNYYIDFCAEAGIPYHSLDGKDDTAWYGGRIAPPSPGADITKALPGLDLPEVLAHARAKNVRLRFWMHWQAAKANMARAFPLYRQWGVEGVMIDFMDREDQEMVNFQRELIRLAAVNHLTVTLHGVAKPTGLQRTYPNLLTTEGVMNLEHDKWDPIGIPPEHDLTVPFTRMLAGPLDYHQGSFRTVPVSEFKPRNDAPLIMGTPCRTLATYVVFQNHLSMVADYPSAYRRQPAIKTLAKIPETWDDTKVLDGRVGEFIVIARRHGTDWWLAAMTDRNARDMKIPLDFLGKGSFQAEMNRDDLDSPHGLATSTSSVEQTDTLSARLAPAGGLVVRLSPVVRKEE